MTVPVVGSLTRKPPWRYLPEIHASRLSISGSIRPKLGLLILCILVFLSVIALLIPLLAKFYNSKFTHQDVYKKNTADDILSEYVLHLWQQSSSLLFSPAGLSYLFHLMSSLNSQTSVVDQQITPLPQKIDFMDKVSVNHTVRFHVDNKTIFDQLSKQLNSSEGGTEVKLVNTTSISDMKTDTSSHVVVQTSHQIKLTFDNMKLTEAGFFRSPGVSRRKVMYDIVGPVLINEHDGENVYSISDLNNATLTLILPKKRTSNCEKIMKNLHKYLHVPQSKSKFLRLRLPIISIDKITEIGDVVRHMHTVLHTKQSATGQSNLPEVQLLDVVNSLVRPGSTISHQASLKITKGEKSGRNERKIESTVVLDRRFVYVVTSPTSSLPLILGVFDIRDLN